MVTSIPNTLPFSHSKLIPVIFQVSEIVLLSMHDLRGDIPLHWPRTMQSAIITLHSTHITL